MASAAVVLDPADEVVLANPAARRMGVVRGGRVVVDDLRRLARAARRDGEAGTRSSTPAAGSAGSRSPSAPGRPAGGERLRGALLLDDVTETRRLEAVRRDFVANVSHELKTPVGALTLLAEAVQDAADDPEAIRRFAGRMQHEGTRLGRLVAELIELSRLQGAEPLPAPTVVRRGRGRRRGAGPHPAGRRVGRHHRGLRRPGRLTRARQRGASWSPRW